MMNYNDLIEAASFLPNHLQFPNSWMGHLPFATWVINEVSPKIFVELGTHSGNSYFSFCQAVKENDLQTKCYAVDTWKGDEHAGFYHEEIFHQVNYYNQTNYSAFSGLLQMTFDEAIPYFADKSIDLLHIDGLHTYEAVKHDFETWLPKLSSNAVVIFHDTNVREQGFGVWKLWEELQIQYPFNLEFIHSHGLGVLQITDSSSKKPLPWLKLSSSEQQFLRKYFSSLGSRQLERFHLIEINGLLTKNNEQVKELTQSLSHSNDEISNLNQILSSCKYQITEFTDQVSLLKQALNERNQEIINLNKDLSERNQEIINLNKDLSERNQEIIKLNQYLNEQNQQITKLNRQIVGLNDEVFRRGEWGLSLDAELAEERRTSNELRQQINDIADSESWRITLPLRESKLWLKQPKQQTKRYTKKSLQLAKGFYQSRFEGEQTRDSHRRILAKYAPRLLSFTDTRFDGREKSPISPQEIAQSTSNIPQQLRENLFTDGTVSPLEKAKSIRIPTSDNPLVSVIIPIYGKVSYTLNCLSSIAENIPQVPFEVIVVDDYSPDESFKILQNVDGIRVFQNEQNQGFIRSCNHGADLAKGEYLYFLNNDTQVTSGWMDELIRTFHEFPGTGLVGSKLIYPDGKLQEAGGIIWQDGSAWNFGRFQDPQLPIYNYAREVDYCSGASIVVPKTLFDELGGFDEHYLPAYCEDSDLALKIRDKGYRVIYQPLSTIIHFEGISSGTDTNSGAKAFQVKNAEKLYARWEHKLINHQLAGVDIDKAKDRTAQQRVLILEHCTPTPNQDAGSVTTHNLMLLLREMGFQVTFIPEDNFLYMPEYTSALQRIGVEVLYCPYLTSVEQHLKEYGSRYDLAFLFRPLVVERNIDIIRQYCPKAKTLYYSHDLHFLRMSREAELYKDTTKQLLAEQMRLRELEVLKSVDASILVSEQEIASVQDHLPDFKGKLHTLPLILNIPGTKNSFSERGDIIFVGGYQHTPNIDAVKYFVTEIMPFVRKFLPKVKFFAVGSNPPEEIKALATDDVIITGFIDDLNSFLDEKRVCIAPLRYGAGIKGKVGTAMAAGLPVVATSIATEGMSLTNEDNVLIANNSEEFANAIAQLYQNEKLWNNLSQSGLEFAKNQWGADAVWGIFKDIIGELGFTITPNKYTLSLFSGSDTTELLIKELSNKSILSTNG
jgi:O-antigen biosynthesis protein